MTAKTIGLVGTGVIGSEWAVRVLARGYDVVARSDCSSATRSTRCICCRW
ncbi:MAG: hypothetical protein OXG30_13180 [bacterium]|nr:hypothetical protein [bacterium]